MARIAIVEDDPAAAGLLRDYLARYGAEHGESMEYDCFSDGMDLAENYRPVWDLLLLDIEMPHLDGMAAAQRIRQMDSEVLILFITNMAKYAIKGYEVEAMGFMLKPVSYYALSAKLNKALTHFRSRRGKCLMLTAEDGVVKVPAAEVQYVEVRDHRLYFHTEQAVYTMRGALRDLERELEGEFFTLCNNGYLINLRHIQRVRKDCVVMAGGDELLISRRKREKFLLAMTEYYGKGGRGPDASFSA